MNSPLRVVPCACCGRSKLRETDPRNRPGHYSRVRRKGWCECVEDRRGYVLKVGPFVEWAKES